MLLTIVQVFLLSAMAEAETCFLSMRVCFHLLSINFL